VIVSVTQHIAIKSLYKACQPVQSLLACLTVVEEGSFSVPDQTVQQFSHATHKKLS
jgi:hypothetical protein